MHKELLLGRHRAVLALAAIILSALILFKTRIIESFLSLVLAGEVPGSSIVISADTMLLVAAIAIWLILSGVLLRIVIKRARRRRHQWNPMAVHKVSRAQKVGKHVVVQAETAPVAPAPQVKKPTRDVDGLSKGVSLVLSGIARLERNIISTVVSTLRVAALTVRATGSGFVSLLIKAGRLLTNIYRRVARFVTVLSVLAAALARRMGRAAIQLISDLWHWAEPHLWKLDEMLELQVRRTEKWARRKAAASPRIMVLRHKSGQAKQSIKSALSRPRRP